VRRGRAISRAAWEFVVGDDWRTAVGVALALALTALLASLDIAAWWVMPIAVLGLLVLSIDRARRGAEPERKLDPDI
jgi:hypothetical protein